MADLRRLAPSASGGDFGTDLRAIVHAVAVKTSDAADEATIQDTLRSQADERRTGATAVSTDEELTNLSRWLYPLIRYRLKGELREDRERAGLLTEHYRRW